MSDIAMILPKDYMANQARSLEEYTEHISEIRVVTTMECVDAAKECVENGARIIVARGTQAQYIKAHTTVPIAEIVLTGQELALLITKAKKMTTNSYPKIAIIGFENMFSDMTHYNDIFEIDLHTYLVDSTEKITSSFEKALEDGCEVIIGGDLVIELSEQKNVKSLFLDSTTDSIKMALDTAIKMSYSAKVLKEYKTEIETVMDTSLQGIIKIDVNKRITLANKAIETLIRKSSDKILGSIITDVIKGINGEHLDELLCGNREIYSTSIMIFDSSIMITMLPLKNDQDIYGVIATCFRLNVAENEMIRSKTLPYKFYTAKINFSSIDFDTDEMRYAIDLGKMYALSKNPVLIYGEIGTEKEIIAQCIHNNSAFKSGPFVSINCAGMTEQKQLELIFGKENYYEDKQGLGALEMGEGGTVFISEIDKLSKLCQYRLYRAIMYEVLIQNDFDSMKGLNIRIIATSINRLENLVKEGHFREDLFYLLNGLVLYMPPIRSRKKAIELFVRKRMKDFSLSSSKHLTISSQALMVIENYGWNGNRVQLTSFLERLFITTPKKHITEDIVQFILDELYPELVSEEKQTKLIVYKHPEARKIQELLHKHNGSRKEASKELGISTATLWRRMKKYCVLGECDF